MPSIGIDVGRSGTKVVYQAAGQPPARLLIPSAFAPATAISNEAAARAAALDTVEVGGRTYWVGDTALVQGRDDMVGGLDDRWLDSPKHEALLRAALKRVSDAGVAVNGSTVVIGLPSRGFAENRTKYRAAAMEIAPGATIKVVPQSMGAYYDMLLDDKGKEQEGVAKQSVAVVEIGQYTTDLALVEHMLTVESSLESADGMRIAAENLIRLVQREHQITLDLAEATRTLVSCRIKNFGQDMDVTQLVQDAARPLADRIADRVQQVFGSTLRTVDRIVIAGGGAPLLKAPLLARLPNAAVAEDPRYCVARGFWRFGVATEIAAGARQPAAAAKGAPVEA